MGLDFSHCDAHWAYSGFMRFRIRLAAMVGILDFDKIFESNDPRFEKIKDDPVVYILAHSDCDGDITPEECKALAPRLRELVAAWPDSDFDKKQALELAEGMETAAAKNEPLLFR